jgi:hypothetical protein
MRFPVELSDSEAPVLLDHFLSILGSAEWERRHQTLLDQVRANPLMRGFVVARHGLELSIGRLIEAKNSATGIIFEATDPQQYYTFSFVAPVALLHQRLSPAGQKRLAGTLRDGLNTDRGLRPFLSEIQTAVHLMHQGYDVNFWDLEQGGGFDYLAIREGKEIEVECKAVSNDLGRQVHERRALDLSDRIRRALGGVLESVAGGRLVRVRLPARLPGASGLLQNVAAGVKAALAGTDHSWLLPCRVEVRNFAIPGTPFASEDPAAVTQETTRRFIDAQLGESNAHAFTLFRPRKAAVVVIIESDRRDRLVAELLRKLKDAAKGQFSRQRAAVLVVQFLELGPEAILELAAADSHDPRKASSLQLASNLFFRGRNRSHLHTVVYRSSGTLVIGAGVQEQGPTYSFTNPDHPHASDRRYSMFSVGGR